jgi:hypothetical protein
VTLLDDITALEKQLDPAARAVFKLLRKTNEELTESNRKLTEEVSKLTAQVAKFQKMLFGRKSEKLPPIKSEIRRIVEAEELFGHDDSDDSDAKQDVDSEEVSPSGRRTEACARICRCSGRRSW